MTLREGAKCCKMCAFIVTQYSNGETDGYWYNDIALCTLNSAS